jgi:uncharacterized protein involved in outer membrane biogenesis
MAVLLAVYAGYALHNPDRFIPRLSAYAQQRTGLQVRLRHIQISLFPVLQVRAYGVEIKNPRPFPSGDLLQVPELDVALARAPLLRGRIVIESVVLHRPAINIISDPDGLWNYQAPHAGNGAPPPFTLGAVAALQVNNGTLLGSNLIDPTDAPGPVVLQLNDFSAQLSAVRAGVSSAVGAGAPLMTGHIAAAVARFGSIRTRNLQSQLAISQSRLAFTRFAVKTYRGHATGDFSLDFGGKDAMFATDLSVNGIGMPYLLAEFENGNPKMTGMLQAQLSLAGSITHSSHPLAGIHGTGQVVVRKGELPTLDRNQVMLGMVRFRPAGTGALPASAFRTLVGDIELHGGRIYSRRIHANFYGVAVVGAGNTSVSSGALDYRGVATIAKKQGFFTSLFARVFKGAHEKNGRLTFSLRVTGTLSRPQSSVL